MKLENNIADHCDVPGMTDSTTILYRRTLGTKFLGINQECLKEGRKHNNTPVCLEAAPQKPLKKHVSMPDFKSIQTSQEDKERKWAWQPVTPNIQSCYEESQSPEGNRGEVGRQHNS